MQCLFFFFCFSLYLSNTVKDRKGLLGMKKKAKDKNELDVRKVVVMHSYFVMCVCMHVSAIDDAIISNEK